MAAELPREALAVETVEPENSDNPPTTSDNPPTNAPPPQQEETPPPEEERPKTRRGRPKGSKDAKPRIRRVPVVIQQEKEEEGAKEKEPGRPPDRKLAVSFAPEPELPEPPPPPKKSPRTLHREHAQAISAERRKLAQAKQAHYEGLLHRNLSW